MFRLRVPSSPVSEAANLLAGWVPLRSRKPGRMFHSLDKFGAAKSERITGAAVHAALKERYKKVGLSPISLEELRSTGLMRLFECSADLYAVAYIAGHTRLAQTERYQPISSTIRAPLTPRGETAFHKWKSRNSKHPEQPLSRPAVATFSRTARICNSLLHHSKY